MDEFVRRLEELALMQVPTELTSAIRRSPDPALAAAGIERWLRANSNPAALMSWLGSHPRLANSLAKLLALSHHASDVLAQNPEFANLLLDPKFAVPPTTQEVLAEGERLLSSSHSLSHSMDRLRMMKQRYHLAIAHADVAGSWSLEQVLEALSNVADGLLLLSRDAVWKSFAMERGLDGECPMSIVAMGKLGGHEVNYSSDLDLILCLDDGADETLEKMAERFARQWMRWVQEPMGRGMLYRLDLRLRPFGASGSLIPKLGAIEHYFDLYAESWEQLAMVRSRMLDAPLQNRWEVLRVRTCFAQKISAKGIEEVLSQRLRLEDLQQGDDLKRGPGGIRDVEFMTHILQRLMGQNWGDVRVQNTLLALKVIGEQDASRELAEQFSSAYRFFRTLEHRLQIEGNQQTHTIPGSGADQERLARGLDFEDGADLMQTINRIRSVVRSEYSKLQASFTSPSESLGSDPNDGFEHAFFESEEVRNVLAGAASGEQRLRALIQKAPHLVSILERYPSLLEQFVSGELEDSETQTGSYSHKKWSAVIRNVTGASNQSLDHQLAELAEYELKRRIGGLPLECVALGSFAHQSLTPTSDLDLIFLVPPHGAHLEAEQAAQQLMRDLQSEPELKVDLRLRPEGGKGLLVRTISGLEHYAQHDMEPWERIALGNHRLIQGDLQSLRVIDFALSAPLDSDSVSSLQAMKRRMETERVSSDLADRHLKHGPGGLDDLFWWVQWEMLTRGVRVSREAITMPQKLSELDAEGELIDAFRIQSELRIWIELQGWPRDLLPGGETEWDQLAACLGATSGEALHRQVADLRHTVLRAFVEQQAAIVERFS